MTVPVSARSATDADPRRPLRPPGLLAPFAAAGVLTSADVHVARRLGVLGGERDERVLLATALTVRGVRAGSVCVVLADAPGTVVPEHDGGTGDGPGGSGGGDGQPWSAESLPWPEPAAWAEALTASPLVACGSTPVPAPGTRPLRWVDGRLYLDRYWAHEQVVARCVDARLAGAPPEVSADLLASALHDLWPRPEDGRQRLAAAACALGTLTVLTGGPGTGKTTTVARLLVVLRRLHGRGLRIALAAPTGKAATRLQEAVRAELADLADPSEGAELAALEATTLHRLLGWRPESRTRFRHDASHHLPHDLVVVDETSMVSLPLMARLLEALRPAARLLLVGDPDQLASVEAGAVLGDLVARRPLPATAAVPRAAGPVEQRVTALRRVAPGDAPAEEPALDALRAGVVRLERVHRHGSVIAALAAAVREGRADEAVWLLTTGAAAAAAGGAAEPGPGSDPQTGPGAGPETGSGNPGTGPGTVELVPAEDDAARYDAVRPDAVAAGVRVVEAARAGDAAGALRALEAHRVLVAHRRGPVGVSRWAELVEAWVAEAAGSAHEAGAWYPGRPLLVTTNDRDSGLSNGDTGVVVDAAGAGRGTGVVVAFGDPAGALKLVRPHRLPSVQTVHAMTVHRGQGSQYDTVTLVLPPVGSPLLTRELLYTAVTRARFRVRVVGSAEAVRAAVSRPVRRASGLRHPSPTGDGP